MQVDIHFLSVHQTKIDVRTYLAGKISDEMYGNRAKAIAAALLSDIYRVCVI